MMDVSEKIRNISLTISGILNMVLTILLILSQLHMIGSNKPTVAENPEIVEQEQRISDLDKIIEAKTAQLQDLNKQIEAATIAPVISATAQETYSLDRSIYLVKFRSEEQREIWIKRNNEIGNFSDETIQWLRSQSIFYVSDCLFKHSDGDISVEDGVFIFLPPCPASLSDGSQPTTYKARMTVIKTVTKEEYEGSI